MLRVRPFKAIRPDSSNAARVGSPPYDVVSTAEARALAEGNPHSFLRVVRPELELPDGTDPYADIVYDTARRNLDRFLAEGELVREAEPSLYLYRQVMNHAAQVGLVCCCHVDDYAAGLIKRHEKTRQDKEDDRTRHVLTLNANTGPVFLTYRDRPSINELVEADMGDRPLFHFNAPDGVTHTAWRVTNPSAYVEAFSQLEAAYVADGHHRAASAARAGAERREANPGHTGDEEYNWFLTVLFPDRQLSILPYNRVVGDLHGQDVATVAERLAAVGTVTPTDEPEPDRPGVFCIHLDGRWHRLEIDPATIDAADPIGSLDVSLLQDRVLGPILGIGDPRTDRRIDFVGGIRGTDELVRRVNDAGGGLAISMYPTSIEQLLAVADAGEVMPPKSTWFEPKLRSGLFVHELD